MATRTSDAQGMMTGKPLIESDRVEGTTAYDRSGNNIGSASEECLETRNACRDSPCDTLQGPANAPPVGCFT